MFHWDLPEQLDWLDDEVVDYFVEYADFLLNTFPEAPTLCMVWKMIRKFVNDFSSGLLQRELEVAQKEKTRQNLTELSFFCFALQSFQVLRVEVQSYIICLYACPQLFCYAYFLFGVAWISSSTRLL